MKKVVIDGWQLLNMLSNDREKLKKRLKDFRSDGYEIVASLPESISKHELLFEKKILHSLKELSDLVDSCVFGGPDERSAQLHLDDKAVTPSEVLGLSNRELTELVGVK